MKLKLVLTTIVSIIFFTNHSIGQDSLDLKKDIAFFQSQEYYYQKWLDHIGLGKVLKVNSTKVETTEFILYLEFNYEDNDSMRVAWHQLEVDFAKEHPLTLGEALFFRMIHLMELPEANSSIQLFDTYDPYKDPCLKIGIYFHDKKVKTKKIFPCKGAETSFEVEHIDLAHKKMSSEEITNQLSRKEVFASIKREVKNYYNNKGAMVTFRSSPKNILKFEVIDLKREVLTDEANPLLARILNNLIGVNCNWVKREFLTIIITYQKNNDSIQLHCEVQGKYGSGYYEKVRRGGYIDMEPEFEEYLEVYADKITQKFKEIILKQEK